MITTINKDIKPWDKRELEYANSKRSLEIKDEANRRLVHVLLEKINYLQK